MDNAYIISPVSSDHWDIKYEETGKTTAVCNNAKLFDSVNSLQQALDYNQYGLYQAEDKSFQVWYKDKTGILIRLKQKVVRNSDLGS